MNAGATDRAAPRRPRRAAYLLPTLFTAGNIFLGFLAILKSFQGALLATAGQLGANPHFETAAKCIGWAVLLDGLDGRIARMTKTVSEFGQEMDSLADVITFGVAPAVLALAWGVHFADGSVPPVVGDHLRRLGYFVAFLFLVCGAVRLARFNIQKNPVPKNPGRPDRKYFVGLPIPAAAGLVAAVVYACDSTPLQSWTYAAAWLAVLALLSFLMVSTWRYRSFKDVQLLRPLSPLTVILWGALIYLIWNFSQPVLLALATSYVGSGIVVRLGGLLRRHLRHNAPQPERQPG
ncbi:MAG: CDP-diacylglycerol--serine O-phosphatidyltransferase [Bryobacterales bacterium]|nr:CDP-diacylglycerol--serine O-phosphatidyltransferase [Bryobacteraceae bacterium]MDW8356153.1 CDP-diacylglycerol--serine O-phosphatidyltransferase [Bryobacterales bacterium]